MLDKNEDDGARWIENEWRTRNKLDEYDGMPTLLQVKTGLINATRAHLQETGQTEFKVVFQGLECSWNHIFSIIIIDENQVIKYKMLVNHPHSVLVKTLL